MFDFKVSKMDILSLKMHRIRSLVMRKCWNNYTAFLMFLYQSQFQRKTEKHENLRVCVIVREKCDMTYFEPL